MFRIPDCTLLALLTFIALVAFRAAIRYLRQHCNIDYLATVGAKGGGEDWLEPLLTLHIHRLLVFLLLSSGLLGCTSSQAVKIVLFVLPFAYVLLQKDQASRWFREHLCGAVIGAQGTPTIASVIFADTLTSFARPLVTIKHVLVDALLPNASDVIDGVIVAFPFWIRLRQCLQEAGSETRKLRPLLNAAKYATNFPVIVLAYTAAQHPHRWKVATVASGVLNLAWDCVVDWEVRSADVGDSPLVLFNVLTRLFWMFRAFQPALYSGPTMHFVLLLTEVLRRMAWLVLRVKCVHRRANYIPLSK